MTTPIGAAFGFPSILYVETIVSAIIPFKKPKSVNFAVKSLTPHYGLNHFILIEFKISQEIIKLYQHSHVALLKKQNREYEGDYLCNFFK